jgi:hypothetical protein
MSDDLLHDGGPESRNKRAEAFENQLVLMGETLGWKPVFRNVDFIVRPRTQSPSRGVDVLWSFRNPQTGEKEGWLEEGKCHETPAPSKVGEEIQTLHDKISRLRGTETFTEHPEIRRHVKRLAGGLVVHRSNDYDREAMQAALLALELQNKERTIAPTQIHVIGSDMLEAVADVFLKCGMPAKFFWPPSDRSSHAWARACPPGQLTVGMLAYRSEAGDCVFWLHDTIHHDDIPAMSQIANTWGLDFDQIACSLLTREHHRLIRDAWREAAEDAAERRRGHLPDTVEARDLGVSRLNRFDELWPSAV